MSYLMESAGEAQRLLAQEAANPSVHRLRLTGLGPGMRAVDVGCGAGAVTAAMAELVGPSGTVTALEPNPDRLAEARNHVAAGAPVTFVAGGLPDTRLPSGGFDYVWCQYVLEYLREPLGALHELARLARPGGRVVVSEIDGFGLGYWPEPAAVRAGRDTFLAALASTGFDLFIGRKLFGLFLEAGLTDVHVHLSPFHVTAGAADARLLDDWRTRFDALSPVMEQAFGGAAPYRAFANAYLELLADERAFKYSVILTVEGNRW